MKNHELFGPLTQGHFRLFGGSNALFFAELVEHLETSLFAYSAETQKRRAVMAAIDAFIAERNWKSRLVEDDLGPAREAGQPVSSSVFQRLVECGWFVEHRDSYRRLVDLDPDARLLLQALLDIKEGRVRSFGGEVLKVKTLIDSAMRDPEDASENIDSAGRSARQFMGNLRAITGALRKIEQTMLAERSVGAMMQSFFTSYVSEHLVADYKKLRTKNNPYRFRADLLEQVSLLAADGALLDRLADAYVREGRYHDREGAVAAILDDLRVVGDVFEAVDDHLDVIEMTNARIERRIRNTAKFLDRIGEDETAIFLQAARSLGETDLGLDAELPVSCAVAADSLAIDAASLWRARAKPQPVPPTIARRRRKDPAQALLEAEKRRYAERARVTPARIAAYLERELGDGDACDGAAMRIEGLDDFFVFERLRSLAAVRDPALSGYRLERLPGRIKSEWLVCDAFRIHRSRAGGLHAAS